MAAASVQENNRLRRTAEMILSTSASMRQLIPASMTTGVWQNLSSMAVSAKLVPDDFIQNGGLVTPWGTSLVLALNQVGYLQVSVMVPNKAACLRLASLVTNAMRGNAHLAQLQIGIPSVGPWTTYTNWPLSPGGTHCNVASSTIEMAFMFTTARAN